jgi:hypothetical protein
MTTFQDIFKNAFLSGSATELSFVGVLIVMAMSLAVAMFIYFIYRTCYRGVLYSHNFNVSVAMMTIISAMIVATISSNVILSLGMVGALSIVRFRTAIKDPIDLIFLFWAVAAGIGVGARIYWIVLFGNLMVGLAFWLLTKLKPRKLVYLLVISFKNDAAPQINEVLGKMNYIIRSKITKKDTTEMTLELYLKDQNLQITDRLAGIENVLNVSLISYNGDFAQ